MRIHGLLPVRLAAMCLVAAAAMHVRAAVIHVSPYGAHIQPFSTWSTAATSVPAAVALARQGDEVLVSNGYYTLESTVLVTNAIFLHSIAGRDDTVLDGDFSRRCIRLAAPGAVVEGFTLWLGYVEGTWPAGAGGAALVEAGTLRSCSVTDSDARFGGGVACVAGMVTNCIIEGNAAEVEGGGVYMRGGQIEACVISLNSADEAYGGGVFCDGAGNLVRCVIADNSAVLSGGGVYCNEGGFMASCLVTGNDADYGGGINCYRGGRVVNCTVTDNEAYERGGGIRCVQGGTVYNSIIYANIPANVAVTAGGALFGYSCIVPLEAGQGNIAALPLFTNAASGDYSLSELSPCIDAGTNLAELAGTLDLAGMPRIFGARADMGAYEWVPEPCAAAAWLCACMMACIRRRRGTAAVAAMASVFLCCHGAHADMPRFEVDASTSGERYYPDIHDNTVAWWEGGNGGQFVWHDWIADEEDVSPAVSPQPLRARMYKRAITWSDEFSADPDIWLAMLFEDPEENPVEVIIEQPEDGTIVTGGFVSMSGLANSLAGELVAVQWELLTAAEEVLDAGPATGLAQWHCTVYLAPSDESYKVRIRAIDAIGNNGGEVISLSATGQTVRAYAVRAAVADDAGAFAVCAAPGAQLNPDIDGVDVVWEDWRDGQADIYHFCRTNMVTVRLTSLPGNERQPAVWGGLVAWVDNRNGNDDIYACWLTGGTAFAVCTNEAAQARPDICAGLIAWEEYRNGNSDIFAFDLSNQVEFCITSNIWPQFRPRVSDAWAVWEDWRSDTGDADIMAWDRAEQAEHAVSTAERNQNAPSVYRDRFAWMSDEDEEWAIYAAFPADAFSINNGGMLTKTPFVTLAFATAYPLRNSMSVVNDVPGGSVYSGDFVTGMVWRLPERDGLRTVTVEYEYPDGSATDELEAEITLDQNPPRPGRISIDPSPIVGNAATITIGFVELGAGINYAVSPAVMLRPVTGTAEIVRQILYEDDTWMGIWSTTGSYRGRAILSVRGARDNAGFEMAPEEFAASVTIGSYFPDAHVTLNEGAAVTTVRTVRVAIHAPGAAQMQIGQDDSEFEEMPWLPFVSNTLFTLEDEDDDNEVFAVVRDEWRNESAVMSASIYHHASPTEPDDLDLAINGLPMQTPSPNVVLLVTGWLAHTMRIGNTKNLDGVPWQPFKPRVRWSLLGGAGLRTVYAQFRDVYGEPGEVVSDEIILRPGSHSFLAESAYGTLVKFSYRGNGIVVMTEGEDDEDFALVEVIGATPGDRLSIHAINDEESGSEKEPILIKDFVTDGPFGRVSLLGGIMRAQIGPAAAPANLGTLSLKRGSLEGLSARSVGKLIVRGGNVTGNVHCTHSLDSMLLRRSGRLSPDGGIVDAEVHIGSPGGGTTRKWRVNTFESSRVFVGIGLDENPAVTPATGSLGTLTGREALSGIIAGNDDRGAARVRFKNAVDTVFYRTVNGMPRKETVGGGK